MRIGSQDLLPVGTAISVNGARGKVVKAEMVQGYPSGMIALHTVELTERAHHARGWDRKTVYKPIKPIRKAVNYSFIETL